MGRKRIYESNSEKYRSYRLRKKSSGRFVRVFVPSHIDKKLHLKGSPGRLVTLAEQSEELKDKVIETIVNFFEAVSYFLPLLRSEEVDPHLFVKKIFDLYFGETRRWFFLCRQRFCIPLGKEQPRLKSFAKSLEKDINRLRNKIDADLYDFLIDEIKMIVDWTHEEEEIA